MDDGSEVAIPSLEALARRIDRGEILPDTELYDGGMDTWGPARDSAVVRFILDEREHEGHDPLPVWEAAFEEMEASQDDGEEPEGAEEGAEEGAKDGAEDESGGDPFDLDLTLEAGTSGAPPPAHQEPEEVQAPAGEDEGPSDFGSFSPGDDFGVPDPGPDEGDEGDEEDEEEGEGRGAEEGAATTWTSDSDQPLPALEFPDDDDEADDGPRDPGPQGGTALDEWAAPPSPKPAAPGEPLPGPSQSPAARGREAPRRPPRHEPSPAPAAPRDAPEPGKGGRIVFALIVLGILGAGAFFFGERVMEMAGLGDETPAPEVEAGDPEPGPGLVGGDLAGHAAVPPIPEGLEAPVNQGLQATTARFDAVVDSLRRVHGMADEPPREWLAGYYFANPSEFPQVRAFWEGYGELVRELRSRDPELFLETAVRVGRQAAPGQGDEVERYLNERFRAILPARRDRYQQLATVARRALELHDFLEAREGQIRYTPAMGPEVPMDPVLEAEFADPAVRSEVLASLDALLQALDRSRGAGAPVLGGISNDLFRRFGEG
jgi:hypothetical protein